MNKEKVLLGLGALITADLLYHGVKYCYNLIYNDTTYMKLLIENNVNYHYEIIESVIKKYAEILDISSETKLDIYLHVKENTAFTDYIHCKYPDIKFDYINDYDYNINCTIYDRDFDKLDKNKSNKKYISHEITERLKSNPNVFFLTPLSGKNYFYADVLPYFEYKSSPTYIIQGNLNQNRRYLDLLKKILDQSYKYKFIIKLLGRGYLPKELEKYKHKIVLRNNLNFSDYHREFLNAYCILPLISKNTHPQYYSKKLTSTINYARGYKLKCLIDKDLQEFYKLEDVEVYNDINDIVNHFKKTLDDFYKQ